MTKKDIARYLARVGRKGGQAKSAAKAAAAQANGKRGGRPPTVPKAERLRAIRARIDAGMDITPAQAALHYVDKLGLQGALSWARTHTRTQHPHRPWWDAVIANLERGVR